MLAVRISRVAFFPSFCALVPGTLALDLPTLIFSGFWFFGLTVIISFVPLYHREESGRTLGVLPISLGTKNGLV